MPRIATIIATGHYHPERCISNAELAERFTALGKPEVIGKFEAASGIRQRYYAPDDWATSDLALPAAHQALQRAGRRPEDVDLIILGTDSPDYVTPATSTVLQEKLGAKRAGTFDVVCACASFPTALASAAGFIATNPAINTVLVIGAYMMRKLADPTDPMVFFYGDGAGAAVVEPSDKPGFIGTTMKADGAYADAWGIYSGGTAEPATKESVESGRTQVRLMKRYPPEINEDGWPELFERLANENEFTVDDVDQVIFTQVNKRTVETVADKIGLPREKAHTIMETYGYTGSACIPMALDDAIQHGKIKSGDLVVMIGSGVGYNQAATAVRMP
ncbi:3-oxoacyl-ACP synthase [Alkalilimnicola ehrlichii]|uniref:3-oxoacyl-ACP synthase n=1 Tax=Alkalilimnicola ehrlichii TaxID=351052 RepID=A0A3E0WH30_9GAMM|nr:ketoacyl-ACP synthase III [Alkalilimnicola ehrlichii]RFA27243.1 3-oxoacyl-ACP synthase [Alkalilimnicola ehrlichii]RFA31543.1 3-oxoacyl-ACP synthase [Alkalilimnicola ehrlichii]